MCTPVLALTAASTAMAGYGMYQQQRAANDAARFNAQVGQVQATQAQERGTAEEEQLRLQSAQLRGRQRVALAATGVDLGKGSALDVISDTAALTALDAATIRRNTANEFWGYQSQAALDKSATGSPVLTAAPTVLGGATQFADRWYRYKGAGGAGASGAVQPGRPRQLIGALR